MDVRNFYLVTVDDPDSYEDWSPNDRTNPKMRDHGDQDFRNRRDRSDVDRIVAVGMSFIRPCGEQHIVAHRPFLFGEQGATAFFTTMDRAMMAFGHTDPVAVEWVGDWADDPYDPDAHTHSTSRSPGSLS